MPLRGAKTRRNRKRKENDVVLDVDDVVSPPSSPAIVCVRCDADVSASSYAKIRGSTNPSAHVCQHILCLSCFSQAHTDRSAGIVLECSSDSCT